jgi:protease-4
VFFNTWGSFFIVLISSEYNGILFTVQRITSIKFFATSSKGIDMTDAASIQKKPGLFRRIGRVIYGFFFMLGLMMFVSMTLMVMSLAKLQGDVPVLPEKILLSYTFKPGLSETADKPSFDQPLLRAPVTFFEIVRALDAAAKDSRVKGLVARVEDPQLSVAQAQELRQAVGRFRAAGKFAYIYGDSLGGLGGGMSGYYLATAFDALWLQPVGVIGLSGMAAEMPYLKGLFDKIGVEAQFAHKGIYKSAPESLTSDKMSDDTRVMMSSLLSDLMQQVSGGISADRKIPAASMPSYFNRALFSDAAALKMKLVDHVGYYDEMLAAAKTKAELGSEKTVDIQKYSTLAGVMEPADGGMSSKVSSLMKKEDKNPALKKIALIYGAGEIVPYAASGGSLSEGALGADKVSDAFREAREDKDVAAVVFRIDSPGGSATASETIRRAVMETQKAGKPVVVSMASSAASGGYWIAAPADRIIAQEGTLTGSIGVFGGKFVLEKLWGKLGVNWDAVAAGEKSRMFSSNRSFTPEEFAAFDAMLGDTYEAFIIRVMEGRKMTRAEVMQAAEGRVFTGRQAKQLKLVDDIGGMDEAIKAARVLAKIDPAAEAPLVHFPGRKTTLQLFIQMATEGALFRPDIKLDAATLLQHWPQPYSGSGGVLKAPSFPSR